MTEGTWIDYSSIRSELSFSSVLQHYHIEYKSGGDQIMIRCPFHSPDKTGSCSINLSRNIFKCFACGAQGNVLDFVVLMSDGDPKDNQDLYAGGLEAIAILGKEPKDFGEQKQKPGKRSKSAKGGRRRGKRGDPEKPFTATPGAPEEAESEKSNRVLELELELDHEHPYLASKGIDPDTAAKFNIGLCHHGITKGRIGIEIHDENGERVAYAGRYPSDEVPDKTLRYKFPKNFHKSSVLYNLHRAKAIGGRHIVMVEGFWSAIRFHEAGIACVALMGTAVSAAQARLLRVAGFRFVTLILDGDEGGREATPAAVDVLARQVYVRVLELPDGQKPDTMPMQAVEALR